MPSNLSRAPNARPPVDLAESVGARADDLDGDAGTNAGLSPLVAHHARPDIESFLSYSRQFFDAKWYSNAGPVCRELERRLAGLHRVRHCITFASDFWGLVLAARALAAPGRRDLLVPSVTDRRMHDLAEWVGLRARAYRLDAGCLVIGSQDGEQVTDDAALIVRNAARTNYDDTRRLGLLAARAHVPLLVDGSGLGPDAVGSWRVGVFGDAELYSLGRDGLIDGFDGGYLATDDDGVAEQVVEARAFGFHGPDNVRCLGTNAKLNEVHAAMALASLDQLTSLSKPVSGRVAGQGASYPFEMVAV